MQAKHWEARIVAIFGLLVRDRPKIENVALIESGWPTSVVNQRLRYNTCRLGNQVRLFTPT
jgi:hypothetical protein